MSEYLEKISGITNILNDLRQLKVEIANLKAWKDSDAIPNIRNSLTNAKNAASTATTAATTASNALDNVKVVQNKLNETVTSVNQMGGDVKQIYVRLQRSSAQLQKDAETIQSSALNMHKVITGEATNIQKAFTKYGIDISGSAMGIANSTTGVARQMSDAYREIRVPLGQVSAHAKAVATYANQWNIFGVGIHAYYALAYLTFAGYGGQNSVLLEVIEAFSQINAAFNSLSSNFSKFANISKSAPVVLSNVMKTSFTNISNVISVFGNTFSNLANNLSGNIS